MTKRVKESEKRPFVITLPKGSKSPTNSIYKRYDIVSQGMALWHVTNGRVLRSAKPFTLLVEVNGKVKELVSKEKR